MKLVRVYRHPACAKCARYARVHRALDWLDRVDTSTDTPPGHPPLRLGQVVVEDLRTGTLLGSVDGFRWLCANVPLYRPLGPLTALPAVRRRIEAEFAGNCTGDACAV